MSEVALVGKACLLDNGLWRVVLPDGYTFETHGPDPLQEVTEIDEIVFFHKLAQKPPACVSDASSQFHHQVIYAKPTDVKTSRYVQMLPKIREAVGKVNAMLDLEGREFGLASMRYRMRCSGGMVTIPRVDLTTARAGTTVESVITRVRQAGYTSPFAKYWIWVDIPPTGGAAGVSDITADNKAGPDNGNNMGPNYGLFFGLTGGYGASVIMHEASHGLGAVQASAPNSNPVATQPGYGFHCIDDPDVMCYQKAAHTYYRPDSCSRVHYDCGHNDYFNPRPKRGSYLADHWNLGSPFNRFFSSCTYSTGLLTAGAAGQKVDELVEGVHKPWTPVAYRKHSVPKSCWGRTFGASAMIVPPALPGNHPESVLVSSVMTQSVARRVQMAPPTDVDVCFFKGSKQLRCFAAGKYEGGTVPTGTTSVKVTLVTGANATYVFSVV